MSTTYPASIDNTNSLPTVVDNFTPISGVFINQLRDAILAIERTLGVNPASFYGTVGNRLNAIENTINNLEVITLTGDLGGNSVHPLVVGLQGRPISPVAPDTGQVMTWNGVAWLPEFPQNVGYTITLSGPSTFVEISQALVNPIFNATYSQTPVTATISDSVGSPTQDVFTAPPPSIPPDIFAYNESYEFNSYPVVPFSVTFTLTSSDGISTTTATTTTTWAQRLYYGVGAPGGNTAAFIQALANNPLSTTKVTSFTINAGAGQAIYFAYRSAYGTADFWTDGFEGGFNLVSTTIAVTNAHGFTENYTLYQSSQVNLGITMVSVF